MMSGEGGLCDKGGCCVLVAKILGGLFAPCVVLLSFLQICPFLLDLLLHRLVYATDKTKQQKKNKNKKSPTHL